MLTQPSSHLRDGTSDHYHMALLRMRGFTPRLGRGYRTKPWPVIRQALHAADAACVWLVGRFYEAPK